MSTRSRIGMQYRNDSGILRIRSIYCHHDGYPEYVGATLLKHYKEPAKVRALLDLGDISSLGAEIGSKHSFDTRPEGETTAYARDRGEKGVEAQEHHDDPKELLEAAQRCGAQYTYLYRVDRWYLVEKTRARVLLTPLDEVLAKLSAAEEAEEAPAE